MVIGGKNYLKLLTLNAEQSTILNESNILEPVQSGASRLPGGNKLHNFNTIKSHKTLLAGGMVNGSLSLYQVLNNGKSRVIKKFTDHKRCINSLDFLDPANNEFSSNLLISGSQDGCIKLWDLRQANNKPSVNILPKSNFDSVRSCQFSNQSSVKNKLVILSVHDSGTLNKYDLRSFNQSTQVPERKWNFHTGPALSLNTHPEKEYVITCGRDQKVCVWNYGENNNSYSNTTPEYVLHTYGPVMKVRWCPYSNPQPTYDYDDDVSYDDKDLNNTNTNPLFKYDFACLYLNEDPTITVYNLKRKYVPKEIVNSYSSKPYQNFIWAKNPEGKRRLWTLNKGNQFTSRNLDSPADFEDISRPGETLSSVSMSWGTSIGDISFISQAKGDFEGSSFADKPGLGPGAAISSNENTIDSVDNDTGFNSSNENYDINDPANYNQLVVGSMPNSFSNGSLQNTSLGSSPMEVPTVRPPIFRASTHNASLQMNQITNKSPSPSPQIRNSLSFYNTQDLPLSQRPALGRNPSQTTIESGLSMGGSNRLDTIGLDTRRAIQINHASPYIIPLSLPLPLNDDIVFETLSNNYLLTIPDGFSLIDVCLLNASVATSVNRFRDCQIWRMLAVGLEQHETEGLGYNEDETLKYSHYEDGEHGDTEPDDNNDNKSILSEYGNFAGSYNSNSTLTTNYGGSAHTELTSEKRSSKIDIPSGTWNDVKSSSTNNLMDMINQNRNNSFANTISISPLSPNASRSNSMITQVNNLRLASNNRADNESAVEDDDNDEEPELQSRSTRRRTSKNERSRESVEEEPNQDSTLGEEDHNTTMEEDKSGGKSIHKQDPKSEQRQGQELEREKLRLTRSGTGEEVSLKKHSSVPNLNPSRNNEPSTSPTKKVETLDAKYGSSPKNIAFMNRMRVRTDSNNSPAYNSRAANVYGSSSNQRNMDLDNENFHVLNHAATHSLSSSGMSSNVPSLDHKSSIGSTPSNYMGSYRSRRSSSIAPTYGFLNSRNSYSNGLREVDETSNDSERAEERPVHGSELTRAIEGNKEKLQHGLEIPWKISNLLKKALEHATLQGDVILCSSLALLFYSFSRSLGLGFIKKEYCLEWLSLYIEILHKKRLFVNATNILNIAPKELQEKLVLLYNGDSLRFYCEHCNELITNEEAKMRYKKGQSQNFGFWFCEKCKSKLLNCVYCNEPCMGLNVVVGLKCGHRGHFGCLREWFIEDENTECPGGCNETVF